MATIYIFPVSSLFHWLLSVPKKQKNVSHLFLIVLQRWHVEDYKTPLNAIVSHLCWTRRWSMLCTAGHNNNTIGDSNVPFPPSLSYSILPISCSFLSTNYCVYAYLRHAVQKYRLSGSNYAKKRQMPCQTSEALYNEICDLFSHNLKIKDTCLLLSHPSVVLLLIYLFIYLF